MNQLKTEELQALHGSSYVEHFTENTDANRSRIAGILKNVSLNGDDSICDYGCGNGLLFEQIHHQIGAYSGVDFSKAFIEAFQKRIPSIGSKLSPQLYQEDILEFAARHPNKFDCAFTLDFSEHLYDGDFQSIYSAIYATIKPGGKLIFHTPNGGFFLEILKNKGILKQQDQHIGVRTAKENIRLLNLAGFQKIKLQYIRHYNVLKWLHYLAIIPFVGSFFKARILIVAEK